MFEVRTVQFIVLIHLKTCRKNSLYPVKFVVNEKGDEIKSPVVKRLMMIMMSLQVHLQIQLRVHLQIQL